jgi:uncharacterized protein (TIGR03435 family)
MLAAPYALTQGTALAAPSALPATSAPGQSGAPQIEAGTEAPAYEVVSVKPSQPGCGGMSQAAPPGRYEAHCVTVRMLIHNAYDVRSFDDYPAGLPGWADSAPFDIEAKADSDTATAMQLLSTNQRGKLNNQMLQALLVDRFKLRIHYETRIQSIYQFVIAKSGPRLKEWPAARKPRGPSWSDNQISIKGGGMDKLVMCLSDVLSRKIVDNTGLTGNYDIELKWTPDDQQGKPDAGPTLFTALQEQLGLKLDTAKGPVNTLVVDHIEKPSEN